MSENANREDDSYLPAGQPHHRPQIRTRETKFVQSARFVLPSPIDAEEWYSRQAFDYINEFRGTVTVAQTTANGLKVPFGRVCKYIEIFNVLGSAGNLYVNMLGTGIAGNNNQSIQVIQGEIRQFWFLCDSVTVAGDGTHTADYRITVGY